MYSTVPMPRRQIDEVVLNQNSCKIGMRLADRQGRVMATRPRAFGRGHFFSALKMMNNAASVQATTQTFSAE